MTFRLMKIEDYSAVYDLWLSCKGIGLNNIDDSKEGIERFLKRNPTTCFVAISQEKIVAVIIAGNDGRRGYIYHTAVAQEYRKKGVAKKLVELSTNALYELGIVKVALVVFEKNDVGNAFWEKQDFTVRDDLVYRNKSLVKIQRIDT